MPVPTALAAADTTTTWNTATTIAVLANDSVGQGDRRLAAVTRQPANGGATVADGHTLCTPDAGFYGSDTLRYALASSAAVGGAAAAEAEVVITVEAELGLRGQAIDAPLALAAVQISGAASAATTTGAQGQWQARVRLSDPQAVLRNDARGSGAQQHVRLVSLSGASTLATAAAADGAAFAQAPPRALRAVPAAGQLPTTGTLATYPSKVFTSGDDPVTQLQNEVREDTLGVRLKRLSDGLVARSISRTQTILDGSRAGQVRTLSTVTDGGSPSRLAIDPAVAAPPAAAGRCARASCTP